MTERVQHRGLDAEKNRGLPNSFESFRERYRQAVELDVFLLRDGNIVVVHNKDLNLAQEQVEAMDLAELEKITIPDRTGGPGGLVPLFEEYAYNCLDRGNGLVVEIKASSTEIARKLARKLVKRISEMSKKDKTFSQHPEYKNQIGLHSFSVKALEEAKKAEVDCDVETPLGLFWSSTPENAKEMEISATAIGRSGYREGDDWTQKGIDTASAFGLQSINLHWSVINKETVQKAHEKGLHVFAWVVPDEVKAKELEAIGVDKIITEK